MITTAEPKTKKLADRIVRMLIREGQSALVMRVMSDPTLLSQLLQHLQDAAKLVGGEAKTMNQKTHSAVTKVLIQQGRRDLARELVRAAPMDAATAMQAANKIDQADTLLTEAQKLLAKVPNSKRYSTQLGALRKKLMGLAVDIEDLG